jgi:hypothetical protein
LAKACVALLTGLALTCVWGGCCPTRPPETPLSQTPQGAALLAQGIGPDRAREIIAQAPPRQLQELRQLMFIADLQMASDNEDDPVGLLRRVEQELAEPLVVGHNDAVAVADALARAVRSLPMSDDGAVALSSGEGYAVVSRALSPALGAFPTTGDCLQRIMAYPADLAVAFLSQERVADHHYHDYNMSVAILRALTTGGAGARALPTYAQALRDERESSSYSSVFIEAAAGARQVLGPSFEAWYWEIQGRSFCRDER